MGRTRTHNRHLPRRVYQRRGKYYYVHPNGEWLPLGDDYGNALRRYADLIGERPIGTLSELFDRYLLEVIPKKAATTQEGQRVQLELLRIAVGRSKPHELAARDVIRYRNARGQKSKAQANQEIALLSHICTMAVEWEVLETNPCRDVKKFQIAPRDHYVEDADYMAMRAACGERLQVLMDLALLTGQRQADLLRLRWDQLDKDGIRFRQGKTGKVLIMSWSAELRRVIARAKEIEPTGVTVVATERGGQYTKDGFSTLWHRARLRAKEKGLQRPFQFHDLRAKSASDDALAAASERLGHASTATTQRVYRRAPSRVKPLDFGRASLIGREHRSGTRKKQARK